MNTHPPMGGESSKGVSKAPKQRDLFSEVVSVLEKTLNLSGRSAELKAETPLLGHLPEMDSLGAVGVIAGLEERFHITIDDDEIDGSIFHTLGSLVKFVERKMISFSK